MDLLRPSGTLARRERRALCDTAITVGSDAPTLCGGWTAQDLVVHLLVRERHPAAALGILVRPLGGLTERATLRVGRADFPVLVERLRRPWPVPFGLAPLDALANTAEMFVHHEDLRRASPGWVPRALPRADEDVLWRVLRVAGRGLARPAGVPVQVERADAAGTATLVGGDGEPAVLTGRPSELLLFVYGRGQVRDVQVEGPDRAVAALRAADLGL